MQMVDTNLLYSKIAGLNRWEHRWIRAAMENAEFSKDPSTKCGAVIVDPDCRRRVSEGYNGLPQLIEDTAERLHDKDFKYGATIHAELNAILFARCNLFNHQMYTVTPPCHRCAAHIVQVGISHVAWLAPTPDYWSRWKDTCMFGRGLMEEAGIFMMEIG